MSLVSFSCLEYISKCNRPRREPVHPQQDRSSEPKAQVLRVESCDLTEPKVIAIAQGAYREKVCADIVDSGYAAASLEAALRCFHKTDSFAEAVLMAANLGDDADTTAAIVGQVAGAYYGVQSIPEDWLGKLWMRERIQATADALMQMGEPH